ncbi:DUF3558 domain-containing protein [Gordonia sp. SID5947]|uniref:DUF3558 family protein n=1 Tax=Gordonia sp. SID5947 TaxID=2690315 RepID=UPI0013696E27|nr:DUF3558 family protein [Gordonia sp. SID5947]MYR08642.1 DUF3558 domain-containing protein [Gordonia sp. SID5947]
MTTRVDSWIWAIRLTKTRSAAGAACRGGHVRVNGATAKPAQPVAVGDEVRVRLHGHERVVEVTALISKRVSAPAAAECYIDRSPPPPPREVVASQPRRDRGAGRPTKRERRELDRLRMHGGLLVSLVLVLVVALAGCSDDSDDPAAPTTADAPGKAGSGPFFGACGGVTTEEVTRITRFAGLGNTVNNPSVCEWDGSSDRTGPVASFNWYRGSPIGRERATEQLSRASTKDLDIDGHKGFIASDLGICEIGIAFGADFFEWSVSSGTQALGSDQPPPTTEQICDSTRELARLSIERAS